MRILHGGRETGGTMSSHGRVFPDGSYRAQIHNRSRTDSGNSAERHYGGCKMDSRLNRLMIVAAGTVTFAVAPAVAQTHEIQGIVVTNQNGRLTIKTPHGDQT